MEKVLGVFHKDYFSPTPGRNMRVFFLVLHHEKLVYFLEAKFPKVWGPQN